MQTSIDAMQIIDFERFLLELGRQRSCLERMTDNQDVAAYSEAWNRLAADYASLGCVSNAAHCWKRWKHYQPQPGYEAFHIPGPYYANSQRK